MNAKTPVRLATLLAFFALAIGTVANAQDEKKKRQGRGGGSTRQVMSRFKNVEFSDEQKTKIKQITKQFAGKLGELRKETAGLMTADERKARTQALAAARKEGKKYAQALEAANKAAGLSAEKIAKLKAMQTKQQAVQKEITEAVMGILTDDQKAAMSKSRGKNKKGGKKTDGNAKDAGQVVSLKLPNMT